MDETINTSEAQYLKPFIAHFTKVCVAIENELCSSHIIPDSERHISDLETKYDLRRAKRAQNFEKFRKEVKQMVKSHYQDKLADSESQLQNTKTELAYAMNQLKDLGKSTEQMKINQE